MQGVFLVAYDPYSDIAGNWLRYAGYSVQTANPITYKSIPPKSGLVVQESNDTTYDCSLTRTLMRHAQRLHWIIGCDSTAK